jgi:phosphoribosylformylglycinamidine cyclo-ligase
VFHHLLKAKYPESFDGTLDDSLVYQGKYALTDIVEGLGITMGKLVLSPTRTYAPIIKEILNRCRTSVHGMVHCSGGAQTKVLHFVDDVHVIKDNLFGVPPLFRIIQQESQTPWSEMYKVFNMGHRMELYVDAEAASEIIAISKRFNVDAQIVGRVEQGQKKLTIRSEFGEFIYS